MYMYVYAHTLCCLQVLLLLEFVNDFLTNNPFVVCSEELNFIKRELAREGDTVKVRYKTGSIHFKACHERSVNYTYGTIILYTAHVPVTASVRQKQIYMYTIPIFSLSYPLTILFLICVYKQLL